MSTFSLFFASLAKKALASTKALDHFSVQDLQAIWERRPKDAPEAARIWRNLLDEKISILRKNPPAWFAGGFGHPDYTADFENWSKMNSFSIREMLCLSTGFDPIHFQKQGLDAMNKGGVPLVDGPLRFLLLRYEQLSRRFDPQGFSWNVSPVQFLEWVEKVGCQTHPEFLEALKRCHGEDQRPPGTPLQSEKSDRREIDTIAQLFTAMAIDQMGHCPPAKLQSTASCNKLREASVPGIFDGDHAS